MAAVSWASSETSRPATACLAASSGSITSWRRIAYRAPQTLQAEGDGPDPGRVPPGLGVTPGTLQQRPGPVGLARPGQRVGLGDEQVDPGGLGEEHAGLGQGQPGTGEVTGRLGEGEAPAVGLRGRHRPLEDAVGPRSRGRAGVVVGDLRGRDVALVRPVLERRRDPAMDRGAPGGSEPGVQGLPEQVVGESRCRDGRAAQHPGREGQADALVDLVDLDPEGVGEHVGGDLVAGDGGGVHHGACPPRQLGQALLDRVPDHGRDAGGVAAGVEEVGHLPDEEGVTAGPAMDLRRRPLGVRVPGDAGQERGHVRLVQALEVDVLAPGRKTRQHVPGRGLELVVAVGADD